jgi:hypothetical protein
MLIVRSVTLSTGRSTTQVAIFLKNTEDSETKRTLVRAIACCVCGNISVQPRYVIYRQVVSLLFATHRGGCQGVFCAECGAKQAYRSSLVTWIFGWRGVPWGPIYSIHAIIRNMCGGEQPAINNFRVLSMQAAHFAAEDRMNLHGFLLIRLSNLFLRWARLTHTKNPQQIVT